MMNNFKKSLLIFSVSFVLTSCAFTPTASEHQPYYVDCGLLTKKLTLKSTELNSVDNCNDDDKFGQCLVKMGLIVPVSYIVSGSIVLVGNTIHWSEYKLSC